MRRNNQLVPIERGAVILMWQTMPLACSYYRRPRLELCHGEIIPYLSEEKWRKVGDEGKEGGGGEKGLETRGRDMNENAYAPTNQLIAFR